MMRRWIVAAIMLLAVTGPLASVASAEDAGGGVNFGDLGQAIAAIVIFLLLLTLLGKYAWRPLLGQLERREKQIADTIANSQLRQQQAESLLAQYQKQLEQVNEEAKELLAQSRQDATAAREQLLSEARREARKTAEAAQQEIDLAKQGAMEELLTRTTDLAAEMAGRIVQQALKGEQHRGLMQESLDEIRRRAGKDM